MRCIRWRTLRPDTLAAGTAARPHRLCLAEARYLGDFFPRWPTQLLPPEAECIVADPTVHALVPMECGGWRRCLKAGAFVRPATFAAEIPVGRPEGATQDLAHVFPESSSGAPPYDCGAVRRGCMGALLRDGSWLPSVGRTGKPIEERGNREQSRRNRLRHQLPPVWVCRAFEVAEEVVPLKACARRGGWPRKRRP